jgi:hypothetical protein
MIVAKVHALSRSALFHFCSARAVRVHWGHLVRTGVVKREYNDISINNVVTLGTRIRIVVMRVRYSRPYSKFNNVLFLDMY